ncbi:MAG: aminopeptidase N [Oligoflexales bacterium]|nr:aminopeptidase N [Oligoflexales bacterium]
MKSEKSELIFLNDYKETAYIVKHIDLKVCLGEEKTSVESQLQIEKRDPKGSEPLVLNGVDLELKHLSLDGKEIDQKLYAVEEKTLRIEQLPNKFVLGTKVIIQPQLNLSLDGLYKSKGIFCTQSEAEGFRKITYSLDRPDVMATYRVRIEADKESYPVLLSNGHCIDKGNLGDGKHFAVWEDPFPKSSYLFALVAGKLEAIKDKFVTQSGKQVELAIYAASADIGKCAYAMDCLKKSMAWDEEAFGLECDLDEYMVVAISDFNLGAMENKGLNIFNNSLVLANPEIARDTNYQDIMSVIGHEYFHNWTGNRVTCRDWFQLCLKEGLTVYRDQEFSRSIYSAAVKRIEDVQQLRRFQWPEDESPLSHPPRPDRYREINNFYTSTVYNKGAEVVRMLCTLIGAKSFRKGMDLYFERFDGQAVRQEDFVQAMADASGKNLDQFMRWYTQAGTPHVRITEEYDASSKTYTLNILQETNPQGVQKDSDPKQIPLRMGLLDQSGNELPLTLDTESAEGSKERVFSLEKEKQSLCFKNVPSPPTPSLFRDFSAPVKVESFLSTDRLQLLMANDSDPFNVWDAGQSIYMQVILRLITDYQQGKELKLPEGIETCFHAVVANESFDHAFKAHALRLPSEQLISQNLEVIDVDAIYEVRKFVSEELAAANKEILLKTYMNLNQDKPYSLSNEEMGVRSLKNLCLSYLHKLGDDKVQKLVKQQFHSSNNMTDRDAALALIIDSDFEDRETLVNDFYSKWSHEELVINRWFALQASSPAKQPAELLNKLLNHSAFIIENPNRMRSVLLSFCVNNPIAFHSKCGTGYQTCGDYVLKLNKINRQMASLLVKSLTSWKKYDKARQDLMLKVLKRINSEEGLSPDVGEIVSNALA